MDRLPNDVMARILSDILPDHHMRIAALVCRRWRRIASKRARGRLRIDGATQGMLAADGCLGVLCWVGERVPRGDQHWHPIARGAAAGGHVRVLDWVSREVPKRYLDGALPYEAAAGAGRLDMLDALEERGFIDASGTRACAAALKGAHVQCARWLLDRGAPIDYAAACEAAASDNSATVLAWLHALHVHHPADYDWDPAPLVVLTSDRKIAAWLLQRAREADIRRG